MTKQRSSRKRRKPSGSSTSTETLSKKGNQRSAPSSPEPLENDNPMSGEEFASSSSVSGSASTHSRSPTPSNTTIIEDTDKSIPISTAPRTHIPPFIVQPDDWKSIAPLIMPKFNTDQLVATYTNNTILLQAANIEVFRAIQNFMTVNKIPFHSFSLPSERKIKILLWGIPIYYTEDEVKTELELQGFEINHVRQFVKEGRKLQMFMVILPNSSNSKSIFNMQSLFYVTIKVEPYRKTGPAQCFSCQRFGHSSLHCGHPPRCVKCAGAHLAKDCQKTREEDPKCSNCHGSHTANFKKCPAYLKTILEKTSVKTAISQEHSNKISTKDFPPISNNPNNQMQTAQPSYASKCTNVSETSINNPNKKAIAKALQELLASIMADEINIKEALIKIIFTITPLLISDHE